MRISIDPIHEAPPHALSRDEIKAIVNVVPDDWLRCIKTIHLTSMRPSRTLFDRPVIYSGDCRLNVACRGLSPEQARKEVLRELARKGLGIRTRSGNSLTAHQLQEVDRTIAPLLAVLEADPVDKNPRA